MPRCLVLFENSIKSEETKKQYHYYLNKFLEHNKIPDHDSLIRIPRDKLQIMAEDYVLYLRTKVSPNTIPTPMYAIQTFLETNDIELKWKKIRRLYPAKIKLSGRKAWSTSEVQRILSFTSNRKQKALVHFLASTGVRVGAIPDLRLKHIEDIGDGCKSILVYAESTEEYYTFLTSEASQSLDDYLKQRQTSGEKLSSESPVFTTKYLDDCKEVMPISGQSVRSIIRLLLQKAGLREGKKVNGVRYEEQMLHGFRKRFNTILKSNKSVNPNMVEKMMGHKNGITGVYFTPTKDALFLEFKKAIPELCLDKSAQLEAEKEELEGKMNELDVKSKENQFLKDKIEFMEKQNMEFQKHIFSILEQNGRIPAATS